MLRYLLVRLPFVVGQYFVVVLVVVVEQVVVVPVLVVARLVVAVALLVIAVSLLAWAQTLTETVELLPVANWQHLLVSFARVASQFEVVVGFPVFLQLVVTVGCYH